MKVSRNWLQTFFDAPLPDAAALGDALTFHAFEIESIESSQTALTEDSVLDVKVTANRGHDCLCHRGIAKEISAILDIPMKADPLRSPIQLVPRFNLGEQEVKPRIDIIIEEPALCPRYIAGYIRDVKVGPSPEWLKNNLEAIGQRSINNIVDATNFVMFNLGQPLHAFDAGRLASSFQLPASSEIPQYNIVVRKAREGEKILTLDNKEYSLTNANLLIVDGNAPPAGGQPIGIAGVKGGMPASITNATKDIIIESANFDGISVRKTAQYLKLRTDASSRYEQVISSEVAAYGMQAVCALIGEIAGGELVGFADQYPVAAQKVDARVSTSRINAILGSSFTDADVIDALRRLGLAHVQQGEEFVVHVPFERLDISIPEDLVEEVGRIIGYDKIPAVELPAIARTPDINASFYAAEKAREGLLAKGYSEVFTSIFAEKGQRVVANKVDGVRPYLRANLTDGLAEALRKNLPSKDLLGLQEVKLFEIGTVWRDGKEVVMIGTVGEKEKASEESLSTSDVVTDAYEELPLSNTVRYLPFSRYPSIVRDISMWMPDTDAARSDVILGTFKAYDDMLIRNIIITDQFKKGDKLSMTFRLVFQSFDKTLTDEEVNKIMEKIYAALKEKGFEIR